MALQLAVVLPDWRVWVPVGPVPPADPWEAQAPLPSPWPRTRAGVPHHRWCRHRPEPPVWVGPVRTRSHPGLMMRRPRESLRRLQRDRKRNGAGNGYIAYTLPAGRSASGPQRTAGTTDRLKCSPWSAMVGRIIKSIVSQQPHNRLRSRPYANVSRSKHTQRPVGQPLVLIDPGAVLVGRSGAIAPARSPRWPRSPARPLARGY